VIKDWLSLFSLFLGRYSGTLAMVNLKRTREDILAAVLDLVHYQGFQATGLKELLLKSDTSTGSFYNYFSSKNELAHALIDFQWQQLQTHIFTPALTSSDDPIQQLLMMIEQLEAKHLAEFDCAGCLLGNLIVELPKQDPTFQEHLIRVFNAWQEQFAQCLRTAKAQLRPEVDPNELAEQLLTMVEGSLLMGRLYNHPDRMQRQFRAVRQMLQMALAQRE
jgi:TetR/AcrR family transcriptional regulator, transcriptional repressor for nem operon